LTRIRIQRFAPAGEAIGSWNEVTAERASFISRAHRLAYTIQQIDGARLFRGRVSSIRAWPGLVLVIASRRLASDLPTLKHRKAGMTSVLLIYPFSNPDAIGPSSGFLLLAWGILLPA
jgi:hypothetical protein